MQESFLQTKSLYSITPFTMLDFPDRTACILWFAGCNMRCPYCYNPDIVLGKGKISYAYALEFIQTRKKLLDGVVLSGGEATLHKGIIPFASMLWSEGYLVKLDTNGSRFDVLKELVRKDLLNYVALDFKALPGKYMKNTRTETFPEFEKSLRLLLRHDIPFEVRTTVHTSLLSVEDIEQMAEYLQVFGYRGTYYLQNFVGDTRVLGKLEAGSGTIKAEMIKAKLRVVIR